ncbi:MAG: PilX N-terminal domain-containing pilus assembly protein [Candidatus Sulfotelmatobacter sp.]
MGKSRRDSRGFTLIAALLLTVLLSGIAVGLLYMVSNEERMGGNDLEGSLAFYGAESGIENLTAQLSQLYQTSQTPTAAAITALTVPANYPNMVTGSNITNMNFAECITWPPNATCPAPVTNPSGNWDIVGSGSDQGMVATLIPYTLTVTATRASTAGEATNNNALTNITGASVNLSRTVEVALLPAFEFGVFCDGDCDYFAGPNFNFGGRVHTNGNLFLASGANLTFTDKIAAVGQVITDQLENGWPTSNGYGGNTYVPNAAAGCPGAPGTGPAANCILLPAGSWSGGFPPPPAPATCTADCGGAANAGWKGISTTAFNSFIVNGLTGATKLQLPFVQSGKVGAIDIVRRPQASDTPLLSGSRLYNEASIRILLADTQGDLHPERGAIGDGQDIQLGVSAVGATTTSVSLSYTGAPADYMYYGVATAGTSGWVAPTNPATGTAYGWTSWPLFSQITSSPASVAAPAPNAAHVWLRVEYLSNAGVWTGITTQWLGYGFGRGYNTPPTAPYVVGGANPACSLYPTYPAGQCYNPISPAILILQQLNQGVATASAVENDTTDAGGTAGNWIPINFYDSREGEPRDLATRNTNTTATKGTTVYTPCSPIGVMNVVELDAGNLWLWLQGAAPYAGGSGKSVNNVNYNGYILYFSDRRGMLADPNATGATVYNSLTGTSGLEDTINASSSTGLPDGKLEPATYYSYSPEDVDEDGFFDNYGATNLGAGFDLTGAFTKQPYFPIPAAAPTVWTNQLNCNSYTLTAGGAIETYPTATGTAGATAYVGNPQNNVVYGPRHGLRLVDGGMSAKGVSYLPQPIAPATSGNGFTVGSEEPVYVWGDYNTGIADPLWPDGATPTAPHSAASIIADSVTLLSNPPSSATLPTTKVGWTDVESFLQPGNAGNRPGNNTYYRMAIAAGKSIPFFEPAWAVTAGLKDFGTDGGMHNFLRYLEDRSDGVNGGGGTVNYAGSLISMYYSQYLTGVFKCCNTVYGAPTRNYFFDTQFLNPTQLPPGTPMFQDVVSLSYHQNFTPQ